MTCAQTCSTDAKRMQVKNCVFRLVSPILVKFLALVAALVTTRQNDALPLACPGRSGKTACNAAFAK